MVKKLVLLSVFLFCVILTNGCNMSRVDVNTLNDKAAVYMENGEYDKAIERLNAINDLDPNLPSTYYNLGIAYYKKEDYEKAQENLQKAISMNKKLKDAYYSLAIVLEDAAAKAVSDEQFVQEHKDELIKCLSDSIENYEKYLDMNTDAKENEKIKERITFLKEEIEKINTGNMNTTSEESE